MKIGLFTDTFYPEINGVATSCLTLERELPGGTLACLLTSE